MYMNNTFILIEITLKMLSSYHVLECLAVMPTAYLLCIAQNSISRCCIKIKKYVLQIKVFNESGVCACVRA